MYWPENAPWPDGLAYFGPELERTIRFARIRCLPRYEVIEQVLTLDSLDFGKLDAFAYRITELQLTAAELGFLSASMTGIARTTEGSPPDVQRLVEKALLRLIRLLPRTPAKKFALPYLDHKRKGRRKWAYFILRDEHKLSPRTAATLAKVYLETGDKEFLGTLTRTPECVRLLGAQFLIDKLNGKDEEHWRGRVLQCLLTYNREEAIALAPRFPWEFTYAAGRSGDASLLPTLQSLFQSHSNAGRFACDIRMVPRKN